MIPFTTKLNLPVKATHTNPQHWSLTDTTGTQIAGNMGEGTAFELAVILNTLPQLYTAARKELNQANAIMAQAAQVMKELRAERDQLREQLAQAAEMITNYEVILSVGLDTIDKSS